MKKTAILILLFLSGCSNIYEGLSNKTSDEAIYYDVQNLMDAQDWDTALTKLSSLSSDFAAKTEVRETWAGVLAGKCGLDFLAYFSALGSADLSSSTLFKYFMNAFTGKTVNPNYCKLAQAKIEEISTSPAARTSSQNLFMAILGMVKMGVYLRGDFDVNGTGNLGDGTVDSEPAICNTTPMSDADLDEVITGFGLLTTNLTTLTTALSSGSVSTALGTLNAVCGAISGICDKTSTSAITGGDRANFRDLLRTSSSNPTAPLGIGSCANAAVTPCC